MMTEEEEARRADSVEGPGLKPNRWVVEGVVLVNLCRKLSEDNTLKCFRKKSG